MARLLLILFVLGLIYSVQSPDNAISNLAPHHVLPPTEPLTAANASRLTELATIGHGKFSGARISPDGKTLAVATSAGVWFYDFTDLTQSPRLLNTGTGFVYKVDFDITGNYLFVEAYYPDVG
ncbi:MAG: hypothetical protein H7X77_08825, partial [Anaerolineae bacterium]|nr:hypothetical protein [Anaerolineae bacterium]